MDIDLLLVLIRQMAALVRRALAEVCTVPELLVITNASTERNRFRLIYLCCKRDVKLQLTN